VHGPALFVAATTLSMAAVVVMPAAASPVSPSSWGRDANDVCMIWTAKIKREFGAPATPAQASIFARKAETLESRERAALLRIPGRTAAGTAALAALKADIDEIGSAVTAWDRGETVLFVQIFRRYLNDVRARSAFAAAGAKQCG
jgi:hypothetical protein